MRPGAQPLDDHGKETHNLSEIMRDLKNYTSKEIKKKLTVDNRIQFLKIFSNAAENLQKQQYKIWQDGYHPVALLSEKWFNEKMEYMHYNPVLGDHSWNGAFL